MEVANKDPGKFHFYVSLVKSAVRIGAGAAFIVGGYYLEDWGFYCRGDDGLVIMTA